MRAALRALHLRDIVEQLASVLSHDVRDDAAFRQHGPDDAFLFLGQGCEQMDGVDLLVARFRRQRLGALRRL